MSHARLAPSAAAQWIACPGSIKLIESLGLKEEESPYAREGSAAHALAAMCLDTGADPGAHTGKVMVDGEESYNDFPVTEEMAEAVKVYVDYVRDRLPASHRIHAIEHCFDLSWVHPDIFGTADAYIYAHKTKELRVFDYKHGMGVSVGSEWNPQLMLYALGALRDVWGQRKRFYPGDDVVIGMGDMVKDVIIYVVQPRVKGESPIREWRTIPDDLLFWGLNVAGPAARRVDQDDAPLDVGKHCRFCDAAAVCPEKVTVAKRLFEGGTTPPSPDSLTPEEIEDRLALAEGLSTWHGQLLGFMKTQMEGGISYPNWKLIRKYGNRAWIDEVKAENAFHPVLGENTYAQRKLLSVAQMEKALKKLKVFDPSTFNPFVEKPDRGLVVAPMDHKSPAETSAVLAEFVGSMDIFQR